MVYVDPLFNTEGWSDAWPYKQACHCFADGVGTPTGNAIEELHDFCVNKLHLKRAWFQDKRFFPHYDLTSGRRRLAIKLGAKPVSDIAAVQHRRKLMEAAKVVIPHPEKVVCDSRLLRGNNPPDDDLRTYINLIGEPELDC